MNETSSTDNLMNVLKSAKPEELSAFFEENQAAEGSFSAYMRAMFRKKNVRQQDIFTRMNISYGYGYKLISGEKRTRQRDIIIEICLCAGFSLEEAQKALKAYGMAQLYPKTARDAVFIIAFNNQVYDPGEVDDLLEKYGFEKLYKAASGEN